MPSIAEIKRVYPRALSLGQKSRSYRHNLSVLKTAVAELSAVDAKRALHVHTVVNSFWVALQGGANYFYKHIDPETKTSDLQESGLAPLDYESAYKEETHKIIAVCKQLAPNDKKAVALAAWAHDLGVPFNWEWDHPSEGLQVINHLLPQSNFLDAIGQLVLFHGFYMDLTRNHLPGDIADLPDNPYNLPLSLFILDFCDAASRIREGKHANAVGLESMRHMLSLANPEGLNFLKQPANLFKARFHFGFAAPIFNEKLTADDRQAMFDQAQPDISAEELTNFYGGSFRCHFFSLLLSPLKTPAERGFVLASVYRIYKQAGMTGEVLLWPDIDLSRRLQVDLNGFTSRYRAFFEKHGLAPLIAAEPLKKQMLFFASKLY